MALYFCDHRRGWFLRTQPGPSEIPVIETHSFWTSIFCWHLPRRMYEKLTLALDLSWDCSMKSWGHSAVIFLQRIPFSINCRKHNTHIKNYYGWERVRGGKETNVASSINIHYHLLHILFSWGHYLTQIFTPTKILHFQFKYSICHIQP